MLSDNLQSRIFHDYHAGKDFTDGTKYRYSLQYNPISAIHTWVVRQDKRGGDWHFLEPLPHNFQFTPRKSKRGLSA